MRGFVEFLYRMTLALWTGGAAYLALVATPAIFAGLPRDEAARAVGVLFPSYISVGSAAAAVLFAAALLLSRPRPGFRQREPLSRWRVLLTGAVLALALYGGLVLFPKLESLRARIPSLEPGAVSPERAAFDRLHGLTFGLNALALALAALLLAAETVRDLSRRRDR